jgi:hypothetical protein
MRNAVADIPEPQVERRSTLSSGVLVQEAQEAIRQAFPYEGDLRVRHLWSGQGVTRCRANWFREVDGETKVVKSLFLCVARAEDGLIVQNETAMG